MSKNVIVVPKQKPTIVMVPRKAVKQDLKTETNTIVYMPLASEYNHGVVKIGDGLVIDNDGLLSFDRDEITILKIAKNGVEIPPDENKVVNIIIDKTDVGLSEVDNTSDKNKPLSDASIAALAKKVDIHQGVDHIGKSLIVNAAGDLELKPLGLTVDKNVIYDLTTLIDGDNFNVVKSYVNLKSLNEKQESLHLSLANDTQSGLMSVSDYRSIRDLQARVGQLEKKTTRLLYDVNYYPSAEEINEFVTNLGYAEPFDGIAVVVEGTNHIWHFYEGGIGWKDDGLDVVSNFTNEIAGIIKGSAENGKVYAETDGTGSVYGWDELTNTVTNLSDDVVRKTDYAVDNGAAGIVTTIGTTYGVRTSANGLLFIDSASKPQILDKGTAFKPITPNNIDYAVKVGMTTNTEEWSDDDKLAARTLIGAVSVDDVGEITSGTVITVGDETVNSLTFDSDPQTQLDGKVDIYDGSQETGNYRFTVYGQSLGEQKNIPFSSNAKEFTLAQYTSGGNLIVASPRGDTHAVTLGYINENFLSLSGGTLTGPLSMGEYQLYTSPSGSELTLSNTSTGLYVLNTNGSHVSLGSTGETLMLYGDADRPEYIHGEESISDPLALYSDLTDIMSDVSRALKTPVSAPSTTKLVAVDTANGQAMITVGDGLTIENDTLKSTISTSDFVTLDTDQAITGTKRFRGTVKISAMDIDLSTTPSATQYRYVDFVDVNGARLGVVGAQYETNGQAGVYLQSRNKGSMGIKVSETGDPYAWAPTTDVLSNANEIATTEWVRDVAPALVGTTAIPSGANLNTITYLNLGTYHTTGNSVAASLTNSPTDKGFMMHVYSPLGDVKNPSTDTYVYRIRRLTTYTGLEFIQSVESSSTAGTFTYGEWKFIKHGDQFTDGYKAIWTGATADNQSATVTMDYRVPRGLLFVGKASSGVYINTYMPFGYCKNRTVYLFHANRDAYLGGNLTTKVNGDLGTLGCSITVSLTVSTQGSWSSGTQAAYFVY